MGNRINIGIFVDSVISPNCYSNNWCPYWRMTNMDMILTSIILLPIVAAIGLLIALIFSADTPVPLNEKIREEGIITIRNLEHTVVYRDAQAIRVALNAFEQFRYTHNLLYLRKDLVEIAASRILELETKKG